MKNPLTYLDIPMTEDKDYALVSSHVLVNPQGGRFGVGCIPRGREGRQEYQGPMVPGPWAFTYGLAVVLTADPEGSTGAESRRNRMAGIEHDVKEGDIVRIDRVYYQVEFTDGFRRHDPRGHFINLVKL